MLQFRAHTGPGLDLITDRFHSIDPINPFLSFTRNSRRLNQVFHFLTHIVPNIGHSFKTLKSPVHSVLQKQIKEIQSIGIE